MVLLDSSFLAVIAQLGARTWENKTTHFPSSWLTLKAESGVVGPEGGSICGALFKKN